MNLPSSSPQNSPRRRGLIAIAILAVGVGWWYWPRAGDQRVVGTWHTFQGGNPAPYVLRFQANGTGTYDPPPNSLGEKSFGGRKSRFQWRVSHNRLSIQGWKRGFLNDALNSLLMTVTGRTCIVKDSRLELVVVEKDQLRYRDEHGVLQAWTHPAL
ncbi:hypothetical protein Pan44_47770 [Caulifigura coniformis]|uniref:Lipocalin-like domain-containing protein n=1 Tax=Caulifigura coniformis TaxID=2527983 RepID=A0A517SKR2_9PLAN|nr:hypothetical protein [Caulifigura coniformis]QDT56719.1 hypothetical protein Pan44_47770 [Caulifigura coniformis]